MDQAMMEQLHAQAKMLSQMPEILFNHPQAIVIATTIAGSANATEMNLKDVAQEVAGVSLTDEQCQKMAFELLKRNIYASAQMNFLVAKYRGEAAGQITGSTLKDVFTCFKIADGGFGCQYEILEESPERIVHKIKDCPFPHGCNATGMNIKDVCECIFAPLSLAIPSMIGFDPGDCRRIEWNIMNMNFDTTKGCTYELYYK